MKKLKLNLEELKVESFDTSSSIGKSKNTVRGYATGDSNSTCNTSVCDEPCNFTDCLNDNTCIATCANTCGVTCGHSCNGTCHDTCDGITCDISCLRTCYPTNCNTDCVTCP